MRAIAGIAAAILTLVGYPAYLRGVAAGRIQPAVASWAAWFTSAVIVGTAQVISGSGWGMSATVGQTVGLGAVLALAHRGRRVQMGAPDRVCIAVGVSGAVGGLLMRSPDLAITAAIAGNIAAGIPTYRSVLSHPDREAAGLWLCCGLAGGLTAMAAPTFTIAAAGFGVYLMIANLSIGLAACRRNFRRQLPGGLRAPSRSAQGHDRPSGEANGPVAC